MLETRSFFLVLSDLTVILAECGAFIILSPTYLQDLDECVRRRFYFCGHVNRLRCRPCKDSCAHGFAQEFQYISYDSTCEAEVHGRVLMNGWIFLCIPSLACVQRHYSVKML